mmetsp:Transcript_17611/g.27561  ORF Transcript_17611/g.27561 Transcript_17611/m.27561 type:complete len:223 (-) Transcript_17611:264-932(-)
MSFVPKNTQSSLTLVICQTLSKEHQKSTHLLYLLQSAVLLVGWILLKRPSQNWAQKKVTNVSSSWNVGLRKMKSLFNRSLNIGPKSKKFMKSSVHDWEKMQNLMIHRNCVKISVDFCNSWLLFNKCSRKSNKEKKKREKERRLAKRNWLKSLKRKEEVNLMMQLWMVFLRILSLAELHVEEEKKKPQEKKLLKTLEKKRTTSWLLQQSQENGTVGVGWEGEI